MDFNSFCNHKTGYGPIDNKWRLSVSIVKYNVSCKISAWLSLETQNLINYIIYNDYNDLKESTDGVITYSD